MSVSRYAFDEALGTLGLGNFAGALPDKKTVRQAYSREAKIRRPDTDPQGFQEIRQAYELVLEGLADGFYDHAWRDDEDFQDSIPSGQPPAEPAPETSRSPVTRGSPGAPLPATLLSPLGIPELVTPPAQAGLDAAPDTNRPAGDAVPAGSSVPSSARFSAPFPAPAPASNWLDILHQEKEDLAARRNALFELLTAKPQDAAQLIAETHNLLQLPALDQLEHRIETFKLAQDPGRLASRRNPGLANPDRRRLRP